MGNSSHHTVRANAYYNQFNLLDNEPTLIINPFLYLGGMYARQNPMILDHLGITHILNVAVEQHLDTVHLTNSNINVKHIPAEDYETYNIRQHFEEAFQFIEDALNTKNGRILVHCALGISRSPTIVIAYIMYRYGMSYQKAFQYVQNLRPNINPNNSFKIQLQDFEYELAGFTQQQASQKKQKRFSENFSSSQININNFSLNGTNPINSLKGSKNNYMMNGIETASKNYRDQNFMFHNGTAPYYIDPASNHALHRKMIYKPNHLYQQQQFNQTGKLARNERVKSMYLNKSLKNFDDLNRYHYNMKLNENNYEKTNSNVNNNTYFNNPVNYILAN